MEKIVVRMRGGLGNQIFILAFAYYIVKEMNINDYEIVLDNREYKKYRIRNFEILELIKDEKIRLYDEEKDKSFVYDFSRESFHFLQKFLPNKMSIPNFLSKKGLLYSKTSSKFTYISNKNQVIYIYGYFQDENMLKEVKKEIINKIDLSKSDSYLNKNCSNIAVSIRWGEDYIKKKWPICSKEYYQNALKKILKEKYKNKNYNILVFADDVEKVKNANLFENVTYVENKNSIEQLKIIMCCDDFVISNSSFSWLGAYFGMKKDSMIIAPEYWYSQKRKTKNILLNFDKLKIL